MTKEILNQKLERKIKNITGILFNPKIKRDGMLNSHALYR